MMFVNGGFNNLESVMERFGDSSNAITDIDQLINIGHELKAHSNKKVSSIGNSIVDTFSMDSSSKSYGVALLDLLGKILGFLPSVIGGGIIAAGVSVGVIMILLSVAAGIVFIMIGAGITITISPTERAKFAKNIKRSMTKNT